MTMVDRGATESLSARLHREHIERRARLYAPVLKKSPAAPAEIKLRDAAAVPREPLAAAEPYGEPIELVTKSITDLERREVTDRRPNISLIIRFCADDYGVDPADLISERRTANIVRPRQVAMYLAKIMTPRSLPEIGRRFGGRDHTTVLHAVRKIEALVTFDVELSARVARISEAIRTAFDRVAASQV